MLKIQNFVSKESQGTFLNDRNIERRSILNESHRARERTSFGKLSAESERSQFY